MTAIEKMVEWASKEYYDVEDGEAKNILGMVVVKSKLLAAEEKSKPAPVEAKATKCECGCDDFYTINGKPHCKNCYRISQEKATTEGSLVEELACVHCIQCGNEGSVEYCAKPNLCSDCVGIKEAERRVKHILSRYRPASPAVEELVRELRGMLKEYHPDSEEYCSETKHLAYDIETILAKYDNAKGDK